MFFKKYLPNIHDFLPLKSGDGWATLGSPKAPIDVRTVVENLKREYAANEKMYHVLKPSPFFQNDLFWLETPNISLGRTFGLEFTFEKTILKEQYLNGGEQYDMDAAFLNCLGIHSYVDGDVLEVPTPILHHSHDAILYYKIIEKILSVGSFTNKNYWSTGGGCHVHIERKTEKFAANMFRVLYNRPWLNYVFQDWYDYDTSLPFQYFHKTRSGRIHDCFDDTAFLAFLNGFMYPEFSRESIMRYKSDIDTLELRFFDMPLGINGIHTILKTTKVLCDLALNREEVKKISKKVCEKRLVDGTYLKEWFQFKKKHDIDFGEENIKMRMLNMGVSKKEYSKCWRKHNELNGTVGKVCSFWQLLG